MVDERSAIRAHALVLDHEVDNSTGRRLSIR
jgi:hypothetical protein